MRSIIRKTIYFAAVATVAAPLAAHAAPPGINPSYRIPNMYSAAATNAGSTVSSFYMNSNQLAIRLTGRDYTSHIVNGNVHYPGSGMAIIEDTVNDLIINAQFPSPAKTAGCGGVCYPGYDTTTLLRNYLDVIIKRVFDGNPLSPVDYDTQTFMYVDHNHSMLRLPTAPSTATYTDTNGDGDNDSWEPAAVLDRLCLPDIPGLGYVCLHMYIVNVYGKRISAGVVGPTVNDSRHLAISFANYNPLDITGSTNLQIASMPNNSFDNELASCTKAEAVGSGKCDNSIYRDDDDGLYVGIRLRDFVADVLFEPPFTSDATTTTLAPAGTDKGCMNYFSICGNNAVSDAVFNSTPVALNSPNITDMADGTTFTTDIRWRAGARAGRWWGDTHLIPGCPQYTGWDEYDAACDLSNYVKMYGQLEIPELRAALSVRIVAAYTDVLPDVTSGPSMTTDVVNFGVSLQSLEFSTDFILSLNAGPFCEGDATFNDAPWVGASIGRDLFGVYNWQTDNPNNCRNPADDDNVVNISDDSTYLKSYTVSSVLPYARGEIAGVMADYFDPATNPGFFMGPTGISFDLNSTEGVISPWFLSNDTDYLFIFLALESNVDSVDTAANDGMKAYRTKNDYLPTYTFATMYKGDTIEEFWADRWGVFMPFSGGVGLDWIADNIANTPKQSCVQALSAFTGYVDGYANSLAAGNDRDNPAVSRPIPSLKTEWNGTAALDGSNEDYASSILHRKIPDVNGQAPFSFPTVATPDTAAAGSEWNSYMAGIALHQNLLSKLMYELVTEGLLCVEIDANDPNTFDLLGMADFLNTDNFQLFIPYLYNNYPSAKMAVNVIPYLQDPNAQYWDSPADGFSAAISERTVNGATATDPLGWADGVTRENPIPRIITGGLSTYDSLKNRYAGEISGYHVGPIWPDFSAIIPHFILEFYVWDGAVKRRAFALDIGLNIGINIDVTQDPGVGGGDPFLDGPNGISDAGIKADLALPAYSGTDFPIGCQPNTAYNCQINNVPSRLNVFLGGLADPELNAVLVYDEMTTLSTNDAFLLSGIQDTAAVAGVNPRLKSLSVYEDAISNLIGLLLSSEIGAFVELGVDPAAFIQIPIVLTIPYIGTSFVYRDVALGLVDNALGCQAAENGQLGLTAPDCPDPVGLNGTALLPIERDISDNDANGFGDYLVVAFGVDVSYMESDYLFRMLDTFLEPLFYACADTSANGVDCQSEYYTLGTFLDDILSTLGGAPKAASLEDALPQGYVSPETYIKGIRKATAAETIIDFEGTHPSDSADTLTYAWRVDKGFWTPFVNWNSIRIPGLLEGKHIFEVKAKDAKGNVEWTPARVEFSVDSVGPSIDLMGDRVQGSDAHFFAEVHDSQSLPEDIRIAYSIDGGDFTRYSYNKDIEMDLAAGRHTLNVRAVDEAGNISTVTLNFSVEDSGFGCSVAAGTAHSGVDASLLLAFIPALVLVLRRRSK